MGFGDNKGKSLRDTIRDKQADSAENTINKVLSRLVGDEQYFSITTLSWTDVTRFCNAAAKQGWRLHTIRDGLRGDGADMGYRMLFERDAMEAIKMTIDGLQP